MEVRELFKVPLKEAQTSRGRFYFYEKSDRMKVESVPFWKLGSLVETHTWNKEDQFGYALPVLRKI